MSNLDEKLEEREAIQGEKMIEVKIRFWTNDIAKAKGMVAPKYAWAAGVVRIEKNDSNGIVPGKPEPFHSLLDVGSIIEEVLIKHGVVLRSSNKMRKYFKKRWISMLRFPH